MLADAVQRLVQTEIARHDSAGHVNVDLREGRPHALIRLTNLSAHDALTAALDRYPFTHEIRP